MGNTQHEQRGSLACGSVAALVVATSGRTDPCMAHSGNATVEQEAKQRKLAAAAKRKEDDAKFEHQMQS